MGLVQDIAEHQQIQRQKITDSFSKGIYVQNAQNKSKHRVGQHYGGSLKIFEVIASNGTKKVKENLDSMQELQEFAHRMEQRGYVDMKVMATNEQGKSKTTRYSHNGQSWEVGGSGVKKDLSNPDTLTTKQVISESFKDKGAYKGQDTLQIYSSGGFYNPTWTNGRAKLHDQIVRKFIKDGKVPQGKPISIMMGGAPASGKSSVIKAGLMNVPDGLIIIDADAVKAELPEYQELAKAKNATGAMYAHEESSYLSKRVLKEGTSKGFGVLMDGTGNTNIESVKRKAAMIKAAGHRVVANYVTLDINLALSNNEARFKKTGRLVPEKYVRGVHRNIPNIVEQAIKDNVFDELHLFDTNMNGKPRKILTYIDGDLEIHDQGLYNTFLKQKEG